MIDIYNSVLNDGYEHTSSICGKVKYKLFLFYFNVGIKKSLVELPYWYTCHDETLMFKLSYHG